MKRKANQVPKKNATPRLYKAVRPDGTDFKSGKFNFATGEPVKHPRPVVGSSDAANYFSCSTVLGDFPGASWPWRILEVEAVGESWKPGDSYVNKVAVEGMKLVRELKPWAGFGPQGKQIDALVTRAKKLTSKDVQGLAAAWDAARAAAWAAARAAARAAAWDAARAAARAAARDAALAAAWDAARAAARDAARAAARAAAWDAARAAAWDAARDAARAAAWDAARAAAGLTVRDLIGQHGFTQEHYDALTGVWRKAIGKIHPDDKELS